MTATLIIRRKTLIYIAVAVAITVLVLNAYAFSRQEAKAQPSEPETQTDKCTAPEGYSEEQWREHMGHHPEQYSECLE